MRYDGIEAKLKYDASYDMMGYHLQYWYMMGYDPAAKLSLELS